MIYNNYYSDRYEVSNLGNIRSTYKGLKTRKLNKSIFGYLRIILSNKKISKMYLIHRLVADAFIPNPENKPQVNHINGIKTDNRVENLEWVTVRENAHHAQSIGLTHRGSDSSKSKLNEIEIIFICILIDGKELSFKEIAELFKVKKSAIASISTGDNWNWLTNRKGNVNTDMRGKNHPRAKSVQNCRGEIFSTIREASKAYNISEENICSACRFSNRNVGKYPDGIPIKWKYYKKDIDNTD